MQKRIIMIAACLGAIAVILGAFGAHGLKGKLTPAELENWKTGVNYHIYHTLALLSLAALPKLPPNLISVSTFCFAIGIILFSGSLYLLSTRSITGIGWTKILGPITPIGGLFLIAGWVCLFFAALKINNA